MSSTDILTGTCLCGAITITVSTPVGWIGVCHCRLCQKWSGGLWAGFPAPQHSVSVEGPVKTYASSAIANRGFCATCGTQLWMRENGDDADYELMPGIFAGAKGWPLNSEIYIDEAYAAFALSGDHAKATADTYREQNPSAKEVPHV